MSLQYGPLSADQLVFTQNLQGAPYPLPQSVANAQVSTVVQSGIAGYQYSVNLAQGIVAAIIAKLGTDHKMDHSILIGFLVLLSSAVPPSGVFGMYGANEKLWETIIATFVGGAILKAVAGGNYIKKAGIMLVVDAASMALTDELYTMIILGGVNAQYDSYRLNYPAANGVNRAFLG